MHIDNYNAFLLQTIGNKEWTIGHDTISLIDEDKYTIPNIPLKVLSDDCIGIGIGIGIGIACSSSNDSVSTKYVLLPGDMFYIPPRIPHKGIALHDTCMTLINDRKKL